MNINELYKQYVEEGYGADGILNKFSLKYPDTFNFAYDIIDEYAKIEPDKRVLHYVNLAEEHREFTFKQMSVLSNQLANLFLKSGIKKGDFVLVVMKRNYQYWYTILALCKIGAVAIPATHLLTRGDYVYRLEQAGVSAVIATGDNPEIASRVDKADKELGGIIKQRFICNVREKTPDHWTDIDAEIPKQSETLERIPTNVRELMLLYFTSGTTGYPKMVVHDYSYPLAHIITARHWQNVAPDGFHLTVSDSGWAKAAWGKMYGQIIVGTCVFVYDFDKFIPEDMLKVIQDNKVTTFCAPPTMFRFFIKSDMSKYDLSCLRYCTIAGEALNPEVFDRWKEYTGMSLMEGFGQTETVPIIANLTGMTPKPGSMGKPTPLYDVFISDEDGAPVSRGDVGEIVLRVSKGDDGIFRGYYRDEDITNLMWHEIGGEMIYHTGDTAYEDEDGYYWYVGRTDDVLKTSGYRVGPFEVESVLMTHPAVMECAVIGTPDPDGVRGQLVAAVIVLASGYEASGELKKEIQNHVKQNTAPYKYPRIVEFVKELPKTVSGKIKRAELRVTYGADKI